MSEEDKKVKVEEKEDEAEPDEIKSSGGHQKKTVNGEQFCVNDDSDNGEREVHHYEFQGKTEKLKGWVFGDGNDDLSSEFMEAKKKNSSTLRWKLQIWR